MTQKFECPSCKQRVCSSHSVQFDKEKICESCEKSDIRTVFHPDALQKMARLKNELLCLKKAEKKVEIEVLTKKDFLNNLERQIGTQLKMHLDRVLSIEKKIEFEVSKCESDEKLSRFLEQSLMECKKNEMGMLRKMDRGVQEVYRAKMELEDMTQIDKGLICKVDSLNHTLRSRIPLSRLSLLSCSECAYTTKDHFFSLLELKKSPASQGSFQSSFLTNPKAQDPQTHIQVCKICLIT